MLRRAFLRALEPPPHLSVSQWADERRMLSPEASAEPGRWDTSRAPFQRAIMDAVSDPLVETVVVMSSAQVGKTEVILNAVGYLIDVDPSAILIVQPTLEMAEAFSKDRIEPMLRDSPTLRERVSLNKRSGSNTIRHKSFPGGQLTLAGSNSPAGLASRPIRAVFGDEIDRWDVTTEGDPVGLAKKRTTTFWNKIHIWTSTPTVKGISRIEALYEESDRRRCFVPCPHCGERHVLEWKHVRWDKGDPFSAPLVCPKCGCEIDEAGRAKMLRDPEWRAAAPFRGTAGFHLWEAYSPWRRISDIVADFLEAEKATDTLQVWVNTSLGETWEEKGERADSDVLLSRREPYPAEVPAGACFLTMGVDNQDDRLEALVIGWGVGEEAWVVDWRVIPGDPQQPEPWLELDELLARGFRHESGALLQVHTTCIDTAGHRTNYVYDYVAKRSAQRVYGVIGRSGETFVVSAPQRKRRGKEARKIDLYVVGTDQVKSLIFSRLKVTAKGPGYIHLPLSHQVGDEHRAGVDEEFIAQLTAEKLITKHQYGVPSKVWVRTRPRNEALDMFGYAIAALRLARPDLHGLSRRFAEPLPPKPEGRPKKTPWIPPRPGGWFGGSR
jgi:phage terminase large subunit GpA-like protein